MAIEFLHLLSQLSPWQCFSIAQVGHQSSEDEGEVGRDEKEDDQVVQESKKAKNSLWDEVERGEEIENPNGAQDNDPQLECEVKTLPGVEPDQEMPQQHRQVPQLLNHRPRLSRVSPVVG